MKYSFIDINSREYPQCLKNIPRPPQKLYYIGDISLLQKPGIAIVGTRRCSPYGRWAAAELARKIASYGYNIISGMADGIDTQAHLGCLAAEGKTIAVLGTGVDVCYPKSNNKLYERIKENGLILSEKEPGDLAAPWSFPERNRIISGLSEAVIIVEGAVKSGSMITANHALEQGREVFAVPGNINQPNSVGVNMLIRDGAMPILSIEDAPETLGIGKNNKKRFSAGFSKDELAIIEEIRRSPGISADEISIKCDLFISDALMLISVLELKGIIRRDGDYIYLM